MPSEKIYLLISKYLDGSATAEERKWVDEWYDAFESKPLYYLNNSQPVSKAIEEGFSLIAVQLGLS